MRRKVGLWQERIRHSLDWWRSFKAQKIANKKSSLLYKIGDLTNISKISLQTMAPSWKDEKIEQNDQKKDKNRRKKKKPSASVQRWPMFSSSRLHIQLENKIQTRVPSLQCHLLKVRGSLSSWLGGEETRAEARTGEEVPSSLLSSQAREQSLSWKQKAKQGHGKAHPGGQVLHLMPHELRRDERTRDQEERVESHLISALSNHIAARFVTTWLLAEPCELW